MLEYWQSMKKLNAFQLKVIAVVLMLVDHAAEFAHPVLSDAVYYPMRYIGRLVFPIFLFLLVESFFKTSSRERYVKRLWIWALGLMVGSYGLMKLLDIILHRGDSVYAHGYVEFDRFFYGVGNNIFLSLACIATFFLCIAAWKNAQALKRMCIVCVLALLSIAFFIVDGHYPGFLIACGFFFFYRKPIWQYTAFAIVVLLTALVHTSMGEGLFSGDGYNWMMIFALPLLMLYNGERGPRTFAAKYFFYIVYPLHLWILYAVARIALWR